MLAGRLLAIKFAIRFDRCQRGSPKDSQGRDCNTNGTSVEDCGFCFNVHPSLNKRLSLCVAVAQVEVIMRLNG